MSQYPFHVLAVPLLSLVAVASFVGAACRTSSGVPQAGDTETGSGSTSTATPITTVTSGSGGTAGSSSEGGGQGGTRRTTTAETTSSTGPGACGDGRLDPGEGCDDGANGRRDDGCDDDCNVTACRTPGCSPAPWTLAVLGDTQGYVDDGNNQVTQERAEGFVAQVAWIVDNHASEGIAFVSHVGDIVEHNTVTEWERAFAAMRQLKENAPELAWSANLGNHDVDPVTGDAGLYLDNFGPQYFEGLDWYGGSDAGYGEGSVGLNSYQLIAAPGRRYLHLNLEVNADDVALAWAQEVLDGHIGVPTIVSTHEFLNDARGNSGHPQADNEQVMLIANPYVQRSGKNSATRIWDKLIRRNRQIFLTLNGHYCCERELVQYNDAGFPVLHVQANYSVDFGGTIEADAGWIRLLEIDEQQGEIRLRSYKPSVPLSEGAEHNPLPGSETSYSMSWRGRFSELHQTLQDGEDGYAGTQDRWFGSREENHSTPADGSYLRTGYSPSLSARQQAVLRFDGLFGDSSVPHGAAVSAATLILTPARDEEFSDGAPSAVHEMLVGWEEGAAAWGAGAWASGATEGVDLDDSEASSMAASDASDFADGGFGDGNTSVIEQGRALQYDVTDLVQNWAVEGHNNGFLLEAIPGVDNSLFSASSEYDGVDGRARPKLSVGYGPWSMLLFRQGRAGYTGARDTWLDSAQPLANRAQDLELHCIDGGSREQVLIRFEQLVGPGEGRIPEGAEVHAARLVLHSNQAVFAESGAVHEVHEMLVDWSDQDSFASDRWHADGVQPDDVEAVATPIAVTVAAAGRYGRVAFDVTDSVRSWVEGQPNEGWVVLQGPGGEDRWFLASSEEPRAALRPRLVVYYSVRE